MGATRPSRVLFLSGLQVHPTLSGGNLRSFALASALRRHGLDVFVYSLVGRKADYLSRRPSAVQEWPGGVPEYVDRGPLGFVAQFGSYKLGLPPLWLTAWLRAGGASPGQVLLPRLLREKLVWCDVVLADFPFVSSVFRAPAAAGKLRVLSTHNLEHRMHDGRSWLSRRLGAAVRSVEVGAVAAADLVVSCCETDRDFFLANAPPRRALLVPNGIDVARFEGLGSERARARAALGVPDDVKVFLFTASKYGPNQEAFDFLLGFVRERADFLARRRIHVLVVGNIIREPMRLPGFTATGRVEVVEPYFAAADAALNPMWSGAGTNVKMCEFIATRLPILTTPFGARGFAIDDGRTGFLFERDTLEAVMAHVRARLDDDPDGLRALAAAAYAENEGAIDMYACVRGLVQAIAEGRPGAPGTAPTAG